LVCDVCDEHWFDDSVAVALSRLLDENQPGPGEVRPNEWFQAHAA
jgi:hypothetical protein